MNIWRRGPITRNPYLRTAFQVARVPREVTRRRTVSQLISLTRRVISADAMAHCIGAEPVKMDELNVAEQILVDPRQRILEELLEHPSEKPPLNHIQTLEAELDTLIAAGAQPEIRVDQLGALNKWAQDLLHEMLMGEDGPNISLGGMELRAVPPFGLPEEESRG